MSGVYLHLGFVRGYFGRRMYGLVAGVLCRPGLTALSDNSFLHEAWEVHTSCVVNGRYWCDEPGRLSRT